VSIYVIDPRHWTVGLWHRSGQAETRRATQPPSSARHEARRPTALLDRSWRLGDPRASVRPPVGRTPRAGHDGFRPPRSGL